MHNIQEKLITFVEGVASYSENLRSQIEQNIEEYKEIPSTELGSHTTLYVGSSHQSQI